MEGSTGDRAGSDEPDWGSAMIDEPVPKQEFKLEGADPIAPIIVPDGFEAKYLTRA